MKHDFLIMGFSKCGTTTLDNLLRKHKDIVMPSIKEAFFKNDPFLRDHSLEWYHRRYFPHKSEKWYCGKHVGEANPAWECFGREAVDLFGTDCKYIFFVRNPIKRSISAYKHLAISKIDVGDDSNDFSSANAILKQLFFQSEQKVGIREHSLIYPLILNYYSYIKPVVDRVPKENVKIFIFEEFFSNIENGMKELLEFIGVPYDNTINYSKKSNTGNRVSRGKRYIALYQESWIWLNYTFLKKIKFLPYWFGRMVDWVIWKLPDICTKKSDVKVHLSKRLEKKMEEYYMPQVEQLETLTGKNLKDIWFVKKK